MGALDNVSVGEEGKDFVTLPIVSNSNNSGIWDIYVSHRDYYHTTDRQPMTVCVDGRGIFPNQLELFVESISYYEPKPGALLLIGQIRDLIEERFFKVDVFYLAHDVPLERTGRMRVYLEKGEGTVESEDPEKLFAPILAGTLG